MDNKLLWMFILEVQNQCRYALIAYDELQRTMAEVRKNMEAMRSSDAIQRNLLKKQGDILTDRVFFFIHGFLSHIANVSKIFWPSRKLFEARGIKLRQELNINAGSPVENRHYRNHLEHFDERLERWASSSKAGLVDRNITFDGAQIIANGSQIFRNLRVPEMQFTFGGEYCELIPIAEEIRKIRKAAKEWLSQNT